MDPNETFEMMLASIASCKHIEASEHATALHEWMRRGGFAPALSLTDRFNQPKAIDRNLVAALISTLRSIKEESVSLPEPSPSDDR